MQLVEHAFLESLEQHAFLESLEQHALVSCFEHPFLEQHADDVQQDVNAIAKIEKAIIFENLLIIFPSLFFLKLSNLLIYYKKT